MQSGQNVRAHGRHNKYVFERLDLGGIIVIKFVVYKVEFVRWIHLSRDMECSSWLGSSRESNYVLGLTKCVKFFDF